MAASRGFVGHERAVKRAVRAWGVRSGGAADPLQRRLAHAARELPQ
jgi:hypothetical protein